MRLVSAAKYAALATSYERVVRQRDDLAKLAKGRLSTITRLAEEVARLRDDKPDTPVAQPQPPQGDAELRRQLELARRALVSMDDQLATLQRANEAMTAELQDIRTGASS
ncbi:hypothetical protein [Streptomyces sp. NPDC086182]|uniref:hypothetical protein n=1 Tax=Streptomyces sp. NPDC086182 TaxID=3155058 RepID=UPI003423FADF